MGQTGASLFPTWLSWAPLRHPGRNERFPMARMTACTLRWVKEVEGWWGPPRLAGSVSWPPPYERWHRQVSSQVGLGDVQWSPPHGNPRTLLQAQPIFNPLPTRFDLCSAVCIPCSHVHTSSLTSLHKVMPTVGLQPLIHIRTQRTHVTHWHRVSGSLMRQGHSSLATMRAALHIMGAAVLTPDSSQSPGLAPGAPA